MILVLTGCPEEARDVLARAHGWPSRPVVPTSPRCA